MLNLQTGMPYHTKPTFERSHASTWTYTLTGESREATDGETAIGNTKKQATP
jgi:hypothetical protein